MARTKQSRGKCAFCGREMTKGGLSRHLKTCSEREEAIRVANQGPGEELVLYHVQVQDVRRADFWLHLELCGSATLKDLDSYLSHPIFLMARNDRPQVYCGECGQPASWFCYECVWELEEPGTLCDRHAQGHTTHPYGEPVALVNSPRVWPHLDG